MKKTGALPAVVLGLLLSISTLGQSVASENGQLSFTTTWAPWNFMLRSPNSHIKDERLKNDGRSGYFLTSNDTDQLTLSLWMEPVNRCTSSSECRDMVFKNGNPRWGDYQDLVKSEIAGVSYFEFYRPTVEGYPVKMLDMYAEFVKDGYWIDLHMSKMLYTKADHVLFENIINSVKYEIKK